MSSNQQLENRVEQIDVIPTSGGVGAEVRGVDLRQLDDKSFSEIHQAWLDNSVLLFRGQNLTDSELIAFSKRFGDLDLAPIQENGRRFVDGVPELYVVSNVTKDGEAIGSLGSGEAVWHTDMSYLLDPPKASVLYAIEVPPTGGNTEFINMYSVYDALPDELKNRITGLRVKHDGTYNSGGYVRQGVTPSDDPREAPGTFHPLVCRHPETGRRMLYLGRRRNSYIENFDLADSETLLNELWSYTERKELAWHNIWRVGDLVLWDNRCTMHRRDSFDPGSRRIMHRTQIKGQTPPSA
jgi:taurine dioxygenase